MGRDAEPDAGAGIKAKGGREQDQPDIGQEMVGEEVDIDRRRQQHRGPERRVGVESHPEDADHAGHVAADAGIYEAGKERHAQQLEGPGLGVGPRPGMDLNHSIAVPVRWNRRMTRASFHVSSRSHRKAAWVAMAKRNSAS
jgi:hypothetical protein